MSISRPSTLIATWAGLAVITVASVYTAEEAPWRLLAVAAIMSIAAIKALLILWRFMDAGSAPTAIRTYMVAWTVGSAAMIFGGFWYASVG